MSVQGIPTWVTGFLVLLGLYRTVTGVVGLVDPSSVPEFVAGADNLGTAWAGRMAGTGAAMLAAVGLRHATGNVVALAASLMRELGDAIVAASEASDGLPLAVVLIVLAVDAGALVFSVRAVLQADDRT